MTQNTNEPLHIVGTDLLDYSFKVEQAIKQGYTFSDLNMYAPRAWPHMFEAWMLKELKVTEDNTLLSPKDEEGELKENTTVEPSESKAQPKDALLSPSVASESTSDGVGSQEGNKAVVGASKSVAKRGRK